MARHLGVNKTYCKVINHFYWPGVHKDVKSFIRVCHTCQMVGKPNQKPPVAPLKPIPVLGEPFSHVLIDCVGPLPKSKRGNQYIKTHSSVSVAKKTKKDVRHTNVLFTSTAKLPNSAFCISKTTKPISTKFIYFLPYIYTTLHIKFEGNRFSSS